MKKTFVLFAVLLTLISNVSLKAQQTPQDSVCFSREKAEEIAKVLTLCEENIKDCESLKSSYSQSKQEIEILKSLLEVYEQAAKYHQGEKNKLTELLKEKVISRRKWRRARTEIALLIGGQK